MLCDFFLCSKSTPLSAHFPSHTLVYNKGQTLRIASAKAHLFAELCDRIEAVVLPATDRLSAMDSMEARLDACASGAFDRAYRWPVVGPILRSRIVAKLLARLQHQRVHSAMQMRSFLMNAVAGASVAIQGLQQGAKQPVVRSAPRQTV